MCGIVGYTGKKSAIEPVLNGLRALEYRGYDSAGITQLSDSGPITTKQVGRVESLESALPSDTDSRIDIRHTRWATHGSPSIANSHPHFNTDQSIFVVHNGIIENYDEIKERLQIDGYTFVSETDTEVIPHLI